jgi:hypothetical protein
MRKDVREFIRRLEAAGLTVESTPGHYRVLRDGKPLRKANGMPFTLPFATSRTRAGSRLLRPLGADRQKGALPSARAPVAQWIEQRFPRPRRLINPASWNGQSHDDSRQAAVLRRANGEIGEQCEQLFQCLHLLGLAAGLSFRRANSRRRHR